VLPTEGSIKIELFTNGRAVSGVGIDSTRPVLASRIFREKSVAEVLAILPLLFFVCGTAQTVAGVRACEQAMGIRPSGELAQQRENLVNMETVREHLGRVFLDWPVLLGGVPDTGHQSLVLTLSREYKDVLCGKYTPFVPGATANQDNRDRSDGPAGRMLRVLEDAVFGMPPARWLEYDSPDALARWASTEATAASRLTAEVAHRGWMGAGRCMVPALPDLDSGTLAGVIDDEFVKTPQWCGACRETSSLTRTDSPLLRQLKQHHGNGLGVRIAARLTEIARLSVALTQPPGDTGPAGTHRRDPVVQYNPGVGQVAAARGLLVHCVSLDGETVADYRILAPTEWNFHPHGVVASGLAALQGDGNAIDRQARLLINSIDPCVDYDLKVT